ncbi:hypothetical protein [Paenibacillus sp. FSL R5-0473]|uniref:hypothetical protein n=1 Tax=Paenibacillus sp. FSL R5-0473 TaxID=2921642 RepID=UPI0030F6AB0A
MTSSRHLSNQSSRLRFASVDFICSSVNLLIGLDPGKIKAYNWSGYEIVRDETFQQTIASDQIKEEVLIEGFNEVTGEWDVVFKYDS